MNPKGWNLLIVSYSGYETQIKRDFPTCVFEAIDDSIITIGADNIPNITISHYNAILKSRSFWEKMPEHVAIFQKDCVMLHMFPDYFIDYDFAGAGFYGAISPLIGGINGGFSLRKRDAMLECLREVSFEQMCKYNPPIMDNRDKENEDVFFTHACEILNKLVPDKIHRSFLAIEDDYNSETAVIHGWNKYAKPIENIISILVNSPIFSRYMKPKKNNSVVSMKSYS